MTKREGGGLTSHRMLMPMDGVVEVRIAGAWFMEEVVDPHMGDLGQGHLMAILTVIPSLLTVKNNTLISPWLIVMTACPT